jgi:hypothetical protein
MCKNSADNAIPNQIDTAYQYQIDIEKSACLSGQTKLDLLAKL